MVSIRNGYCAIEHFEIVETLLMALEYNNQIRVISLLGLLIISQ
jgi:hypothetical protein